MGVAQALSATVERSAAAVKDGRRRPGRPGSVRLTRQFQESLTLLGPDEIARVYRALRLLLDRLPDRQVSTANADEGRFAVPDTAIALAFTKSSASDDVLVHALYRSGQRLEHPEADAAGEGRPSEDEGRSEGDGRLGPNSPRIAGRWRPAR